MDTGQAWLNRERQALIRLKVGHEDGSRYSVHLTTANDPVHSRTIEFDSLTRATSEIRSMMDDLPGEWSRINPVVADGLADRIGEEH